MSVIASRPPNFSDIVRIFPGASGPDVIFAYAPHIYAPNGRPLPPSLIAHENVHIARQQEIGVEVWWNKYLTDIRFRYNEELLAHRAEYNQLIGSESSRPLRRSALKITAKRLSSKLYGGFVSVDQAMKDIAA